MAERYAVYYAPARGSRLEAFGASWLGRAPREGEQAYGSPIGGMDTRTWESLTRAPRFYGFHGTLKPPFELRDGVSSADVLHCAQTLATRHSVFSLSGLDLREIGSFLALVPAEGQAIASLAEACLREFESFRADPDPADVQRRKAKRLSARQEELLMEWGYPYVLDEFRFHLTLTGPILDVALRRTVLEQLQEVTADFRNTAQAVEDLCIFHQPDRESPFQLLERFPFRKGV